MMLSRSFCRVMADVKDTDAGAVGNAAASSPLPNPYAGLGIQPPEIEGFQVWQAPPQEGFAEKFKRKTMENPFVPIGCGLTAAALIYGVSTFSRGDSKTGQKMMRARVLAQGFTIGAILLGVVYSGLKGTDKNK